MKPLRATEILAGTFAFIALLGLIALTQPLKDFVEYWTAAHLFVEGGNPYSLADVFHREVALGWREPFPLMVLNPPWALPLLVPLGLFRSYLLAWIAWTAFLTSVLLLSSYLLLELYAPDVCLPRISDSALTRSLFVFSFYPAFLVLRFSQVTALAVLGIVLFLRFNKSAQPILAGSALALAALKPHLVYLVLLAVIVQSIRDRSGKILVGLAATTLLLTGIALLFDRHVVREYLVLSGSPYTHLYPAALGRILRLPFPTIDAFWLQFVPASLGLLWFACYVRKLSQWNWLEQMPVIVLVSVVSAAYGWLFDQVLLAIPLVYVFAGYGRKFGRLPRFELVMFTAVNLVLIVAAMLNSPFAYLPAPLLFLWLLNRTSNKAHDPQLQMDYLRNHRLPAE